MLSKVYAYCYTAHFLSYKLSYKVPCNKSINGTGLSLAASCAQVRSCDDLDVRVTEGIQTHIQTQLPLIDLR